MRHKVLTRHPEGKQGVRIDRDKYELMRQSILDELVRSGELTFGELRQLMEQRLEGHLVGSISWYFTTVKLDLEARKLIERLPGSSPQRLRLVANE